MFLVFADMLLAAFMLLQLSSAAYISMPNTDVTVSTILNPTTALYRVPGVDFDGDDLYKTPVSDEAACAQLCTGTPACFTYTYDTSQFVCLLKYGTGKI